MKALSCRFLDEEDQQQWRALRLEALERHPLSFLATAEEQRARTAEEDRQQLANGCWIGLFDGARMVGQGAIVPMRWAAAQHRAEIGAFYVAEGARGSGAAQALLDALVQAAQARKVLQLELDVLVSNERAIRFYERNGFVRTGHRPRVVIRDGTGYDDYTYVRFLDGHTPAARVAPVRD